MSHTPRYVPARTNEGWPVVGLVVLLTAACIASVTVIYQRTYKHPTDPTRPSSGVAHAASAPAEQKQAGH